MVFEGMTAAEDEGIPALISIEIELELGLETID